MQEKFLPYFYSRFGKTAIVAYLIVLLVCILVFPVRLPLLWIFTGILAVVSFFTFTRVYSLRWRAIPDKMFERKLFKTALIIRLVYVVIIYFFYLWMNGNPFEFSAADSIGYHEEATWIIDLFHAGMMDYYYTVYAKGVSDSGWPMMLAFIYFFSFKSIFVVRLMNALMSAWMVVLIYRLAQRNFGVSSARITAIMAMLLPTFIYYSGLHVKETAMIFLLVVFSERADFMIRSGRLNWSVVIQVVLSGIGLFFFRTVLAVAAWFALFSALIFTSKRILKYNIRVISIFWFLMAALVIFSGRIWMEIEKYAEGRFTNQQGRLHKLATGEGANEFASLGSKAIFFPLMVVAPFPTMVNIESQRGAMMINGANFTRNVYAFFVLLALWAIIKHKLLRQKVLVITILFGYLFILGSSGFALSERFHMPLLPFLLILAGYGVTIANQRKYSNLYIPYLLLICAIVIGWNWFKLAGRGMI
jgi:hypothetical protein